ncbi:MAG: dihydrofolate reductase family protein [Isosphaeraceae bacterium]
MRKLIYGGANSLDNYIASADHSVDWLMWGGEAADLIAEQWKSIDCVLMGRNTYELAMRNGVVGGSAGVECYVFSRTLGPSDLGEGAALVRDDAAGFVRGLKDREGKDICLMCGGGLASTLLEAGLVDEVGVNIHPVLIGSGVPLFGPIGRQVDLELKECRAFRNGCVYLAYRVKN